jgi:chemotaxis protein methyltransferase CheR
MCVAEWAATHAINPSVQILGTDISDTMLKQARTGIYSDMAINRGLASQVYTRYFQKGATGHQLNTDIMRRVRFQKLNLLQPFANVGKFDIIFCRNVLIYFSEAVKRDILQRLVAALEPGGYLFLSSTESIPMDLKTIEPVRGKRARYFKKNAGLVVTTNAKMSHFTN